MCIIEGRHRSAGILIGLAFLISQKAIWYFIAINGGMLLCRPIYDQACYSLRSFVSFNLAAFTSVAIYCLIWSLASSPSIVLHSLFYDAYVVFDMNWYKPIYLICWQAALYLGPLLFFLWPFTLLSLFNTPIDAAAQQRVFIIAFASIALLQFIVYKQPFPYNFVFTFPAFFLLYTDFIAWLLSFVQVKDHLLPSGSFYSLGQYSAAGIKARAEMPKWLLASVAIYSIGIVALVYLLNLPVVFYSIALFPPIITQLVKSNKRQMILIYLASSIFLLTGIITPLLHTTKENQSFAGDYQRSMLRLADELTQDGSEYVGGVPFIYQKDQPINGAKNLTGPAIDFIYSPSDNLATLLLPSLYQAPITSDDIIRDFETMPIKVVISNYRMLSLPANVLSYIASHYRHFYGSIYLYSPIIQPSVLSFYVKFAGKYRIETASKSPITIDGLSVKPGQVIPLAEGNHNNHSTNIYRLNLIPEVDLFKYNPELQKDNWSKMLKTIMA